MKGAAFAVANDVCHHVLLLKCRNHGLAGVLTPSQAVDVNKVEPLSLIRIHEAQAGLELNAQDPSILELFMAIVTPDPANLAHQHPIAIHGQLIAAMRAELGLGPLPQSAGRSFPVNVPCNAK
jgi:hypothetical protein